MTSSWWYRSQANAAQDNAADCRSAGLRLREVASDLTGRLDDVVATTGVHVWESTKATTWRGERDDIVATLADAEGDLNSEADLCDRAAIAYDNSADWYWRQFWVAYADEQADSTTGVLS